MADKQATMFLLKYLQDNTDMDHPVTSSQLKAILKEKGFAADPRTIRADVNQLVAAGYDIIINERNGVSTSYHFGSREWDKTELRILIDAVASAQFITNAKTRSLIKKLSVLAGKQYEAELTPSVYISEHIKAGNNQILYILQAIAEGIRINKKIAFKHYQYDLQKKRIPRNGNKKYIVSPYATIWKEDRYYLVGYSEKHEGVATFRIDRMGLPEILEEDRVPPLEGFNVQTYADRVARMYTGAETEVTLRCRAEMVSHIIDKFGSDIEITNVKEDTFDVTVLVSVSGTFLSWVFQYAGSMTILGPEPVREMYFQMIRTTERDLSAGRLVSGEGKSWKLQLSAREGDDEDENCSGHA